MGKDLQVGMASLDMTTSIPDGWRDLDGDGVYDSWNDVWLDGNGNHRFDARWMAGFRRSKPATSTLHPLSVRAIVLKRADLDLAVVSLDNLGIFYPQVVRLRLEEASAKAMDHVLVCSTHSHAAVDCMGYWSPDGVDQDHLEFIRKKMAQAIELARRDLSPVDIRVASSDMSSYVTDSRIPPRVIDPQILGLQFLPQDGKAPVTMVFAACHPTLLGRNSKRFTPDWPYFLRNSLEDHYSSPGRCMYLQGAVGGHMIPKAKESHVPFPQRLVSAHSMGENLACALSEALDSSSPRPGEDAPFSIRAQSIFIPMKNWRMWVALGLGYFSRGTFWPFRGRSEVDLLELGPLQAFTMPGEIFPEQFLGGIVNPPGADERIAPVEIPPLVSFLGGEYQAIIGLGNDELGYIVPHSEWDEEPPHLAGEQHAPGQEYACPSITTAMEIHQLARSLASLECR